MAAAPASGAADRPPIPRLWRITPVVASVGVGLVLLGVLLLLRPIETPTQDCGTAYGFLMDGRSNVILDPDAPPPGRTADDVEDNNARPCRERVADAALPAAALIALGLLGGVGAALVEIVSRSWGRRTRRRAARATAPPPPP